MAVAGLALFAALVGSASYLNAKGHIAHDLQASAGLNNAKSDALRYIEQRQRLGKPLTYHYIQEHAEANHPNHLFLEFENRSWTYRQFYEALQKVGNWLMDELDVQKGEMVAIDGPNSPEYMMLWFALNAIGAKVSFINHNLTGHSLSHCVQLCECRYLITDYELRETLETCKEELLGSGVQIIFYDQALIESLSKTTPLPASRSSDIKGDEIMSLIYTSGTSGLPKGVNMSAARETNVGRSVGTYLKLKRNDKFYTCLPLYHGSAQGLCTGPVIWAGASLRLSRKFSHKTFWPEVVSSGATRLHYVGELCRYLVNAPVHPDEGKHKLVEAWGNGMRADVWERFRSRFGIPVIHELYGATDGVGLSLNRNRGDFSRGAIGVRGWLWHLRHGRNEVRARIDPDTEDLLRGDDGFAVECGVNEPGEVLHRIPPEMAKIAFKGYFKNQQASEKRWMQNVFSTGDLFLRTGDVMRVDSDGRVWFVDRLGDTFRWKSENVSTSEVADVLGSFSQVAEAAVYGIQIPHADGRCGCATIVPKTPMTVESFDFEAFAKHTERLPRYAVPIFLRMTTALCYTGTFKIQKGQAKREGVDLDLLASIGSTDDIFWMPPNTRSYTRFRPKDWEHLKAESVRL